MNRLRRIRRWWPAIPVALAALLVYAAWPGRSTFTVSPETTYVTAPLDDKGYVDYQTALNERLGKDVAPETNANVLIWQALGPHPEGATMPPEYFKWLGVASPPEAGEYFIDRDKYFEKHLNDLPEDLPDDPPDELEPKADRRRQWSDRVDRAGKWPWKPKDEPDIVAWLKRNEKPLAVAIEASKRTQYFNPLVSKSTDPQSARLISCLLPSVQKCREVANALACRAMSRVGEGDFDGAWQDLLACQRLGRLMGSCGTMIETLVGVALVSTATNAQVALLGHVKHSSKQVLAWLEDLRKLPPMPSLADKLDLGERFLMLEILMSIAYHGPKILERLDGPGLAPPHEDRVLDRLFTSNIDLDPAFRNTNRMFDRMAAACRLPDRAARERELANIVDEIKRIKSDVDRISVLDRVVKNKSERGEMIGNILIALVIPAFNKVQDALDRTEQTQRNLHVAFALAAYRADAGRYPARLDDLAPKYLAKVPPDTFSGQPLIYRPTDDGYLLYSFGVNGTDEEGRSTDDFPRGDDLRVRMPVTDPAQKAQK
jgi:hypothetical protein